MVVPGTTKEFHPDRAMPKHQVLGKTFRYLGLGTNYFFNKDSFYYLDLDPNSATAPIAQKAAELGITESNSRYFKMAKRVTRAEFAHYLYRIANQDTSTTKIQNTITIGTTKDDLNIDLHTLENVYETLKTSYLYRKDVDFEEIVVDAIKGMLSNLEDPYTVFQTPEEAEKFLQSIDNEFEGIGALLEVIDEKITIISPLVDSPAEKSGIRAADVIIKVNGEDIRGQSLELVISKIKGPAGTNVVLTVERGSQELDITITREKIIYEGIQPKMLTHNGKKVAHIKVTTFGNLTFTEFYDTVNEMLEENPAGFIIDLRNNPGGYLESAIQFVSGFTSEEKVAVKVHHHDGTFTTYNTNGNGLLEGKKSVVLINQGSASSSEILAGALQDYGLAIIVGETSFGKGTVQQLKNYSDGSLFKYTTAQWLTPNGHSIQDTGITPDIIVDDLIHTTTDEQLEKALDQF